MAAEGEAAPAAHQGGFSFFVAVCFTVNYIMGCGFLGVPKGFVDAGMFLGPLLLVLFSFLCNVTKDFLLEAMARTEAYTRATVDRASGDSDPKEPGVLRKGDFEVTDRKFELVDMAQVLVGKHARAAYITILSLYMYGTLWAYTSVFGASMAANVPSPFHDHKTCDVDAGDCNGPYHFFLFLFALVAVPLSCMNLEEQISVQVAMSAARVVVVVMMVGTIFSALNCDGHAFTDIPEADKQLHSDSSFDFGGLPVLVPVAVYASIFHHSVPILAQPVRDKSRLRAIFATAFTVTCVFYIAVGLCIGLYFGEIVNSQCNLNWSYYEGCRPEGVTNYSRPWWVEVVRFLVLVFPALDVLSAFPLNAITLGNNTMVLLIGVPSPAELALPPESTWNSVCCTRCRRGAARDGYAVQPSEGDGDLDDDTMAAALAMRKRRSRMRIAFRLLAAVPPIIGAAFVSDLGKILQYTGLVGIALAFVVPPFLRHFSIQRCQELVRSTVVLKDVVTEAARSGKTSTSPSSAEDYLETNSSPSQVGVDAAAPVSNLLDRTSTADVLSAGPDFAAELKTPYHSLWSLGWVQWGTLGFGVVVFAYIFGELVSGH